MDWDATAFIVLIIALSTGGWLINNWIRAKHGYDLEDEWGGKTARAEPIAALYEAGRVRHTGLFAALEDEMCGLVAGGGYEGPGRSPDRADALVWALTELMLVKRTAPRVRWI